MNDWEDTWDGAGTRERKKAGMEQALSEKGFPAKTTWMIAQGAMGGWDFAWVSGEIGPPGAPKNPQGSISF